MFLLAVLALVSLAAGIRSRQVKPRWSVLFFLLGAGVFLAWLMEYSWAGGLSFFTSDEETYYSYGQTFTWSDFISDRGLWVFINHWLIRMDVPTSGFALKIVNVFFLYLLLLLLSRVYLEGAIFKSAILLLPYFFIVAIHNLRDILLLLLMTASLYCLARERKRVLAGMASLSLLFFLRPIFAGIVVVMVGGILFIQMLRGTSLAMKLRALAVLALFGIAVGPAAYKKLDLAYRRASSDVVEGGARLELTMEQGYATGNRARDLAVACARYAFSPLPTSILHRLSAGGTEEWGRVDDIVRAWNQIGYFILLIFMSWRWRSALSAIKRMTRDQKAVLLSLFMYLPAYSLHLYGACHQRLKLPFQMCILIVAVLAWRSGRRQQGQEDVPGRERIAEVGGVRQDDENPGGMHSAAPGAGGEETP